MENQFYLFDQVDLSFHDCFIRRKPVKPIPKPKPKPKIRAKSTKQESSDNSALNSLLPFLFPEDYPELQEQIDSINVIWTDEDLELIEKKLLFSTFSVLLDYRSGVRSRDEAYAWLANDDIAPFSYRVCVLSQGGRAEAFRFKVYNRLTSERRKLRRSQSLTKREAAYLDWINHLAIPSEFEEEHKLTAIETLAWIDELDEINQAIAEQSGYF